MYANTHRISPLASIDIWASTMFPITCNAVGDILALASLALDMAKALNEIHGSPASYRALRSELESLHIVLASVHRAAELTNDTLLREQIVHQVERYIGSIRIALLWCAEGTDDSVRIKVNQQWYKIGLRFHDQRSIASIRDKLAFATRHIAAYLPVSNGLVELVVYKMLWHVLTSKMKGTRSGALATRCSRARLTPRLEQMSARRR